LKVSWPQPLSRTVNWDTQDKVLLEELRITMQYFCTTKSGGTLALLPEENSYSVPDLRFKDFADLALQQFHVGRTCSQMK
jgi:hypothetical protein